MRKHLQLALMASPVIATFLFLTMPYVEAEAGSGGTSETISATDESGHKVYVNDYIPATKSRAWHAPVAAQFIGLLERERAPLEAGTQSQRPRCPVGRRGSQSGSGKNIRRPGGAVFQSPAKRLYAKGD
jgi:hypothetical protein